MSLRPVAVCLALVGCIASDDITQTAKSEAIAAIEQNDGIDVEERLAETEQALADVLDILGDAPDDAPLGLVQRVADLEDALDAEDSEDDVVGRLAALETAASDLRTDLQALETTVGTRGEAGDVYTELAALRTGVEGLTTGLGGLTGDVDDLRDDVGILESDEDPLADQTRALSAWRTETVTPTLTDFEARVGDIESSYASVAYVDAEITATELYCDDAVHDLDAVIPDVIATDTTWTVDGSGGTSTTFVTPAAAVAAAQDVRIAPDAVLTIEIDDGTYTATSPLEVRHPNGAQLEIVGNTADPSKVVLRFNGSDGIIVEDGYVLGLLDGVTVQGDDTGTQKAGLVVESAIAYVSDQVTLEGFSGFGLWARTGAIVHADGVTSKSNGIDGLYVNSGSVLVANDLSTQTNRHGISVSGGSYADVTDGNASANSEIGFYATNGSAINAVGAFAVGNSGDGFRAFAGSSIYSVGSSANSNRQNGFQADSQSVVVMGSGSGNSFGLTTPSPNTEGNLNAIVVRP